MSGEITGGIKVEAVHKQNAPLPPMEPGKHLWVMTAAWRVSPMPNQQALLDLENLITIDGPGCFWCGEPWTLETESRHCAGDVCR